MQLGLNSREWKRKFIYSSVFVLRIILYRKMGRWQWNGLGGSRRGWRELRWCLAQCTLCRYYSSYCLAQSRSHIPHSSTTASQPEGTLFLGHLHIYIVIWDTTLNADQILSWVPLLLNVLFCWILVADNIRRDQPQFNYIKNIVRKETKHF